ncbi:glycosyltransferase family 2 protein [Enterococcus dongliensis]|uniref:glycosyltransferase family 2 protein n=1 Tax=Enterococcus dongliensis TaxID=2559925 RepID=UPI00288CDDFF|nr:glycosyltransferase family 2 protein [Enterococcus dongliensis]MDT2603107.1 glycosyltransferase family 2 protein [Enterococcus dongliensis]MDT2675548.1 glycosyltransferase family 2 protein [Enterococcus dongliensis]
MKKSILISIPTYNEEDNIIPLYEKLKENLEKVEMKIDFEVLFINDGSNDNTASRVLELMKVVDDVSLINLSRNFGKEIAMCAGFDYSNHDAVITMDADLQHPPEIIGEMIKLWVLGYDDVYAKRNKRNGESWFKKFSSKMFYKILDSLSETTVLADAGDFRLLDRKVVDAITRMRETQRYTKGIYNWVGFKKIAIQFDAEERLHGETKWNFSALLKLAVEGITSYTTAPLKLSMYFGFLISFVAFVYMIYVFIKTIIFGADTSGFPSLMIIILFLGGCQLISIGIIGEYLGRVFMESKERPLYFIENSYIAPSMKKSEKDSIK